MPSSVLVLSLTSVLLQAPLVGPSVGNADVLSTEGVRLYNQKQYGKAADTLTKAIRANPAGVPPYLTLARSLMANKKVPRACQVYRAYLKAAPDSLDRDKAESELELCDRQTKAAGKTAVDNTAKIAEARALLYAALEEGKLVGAGSAGEALTGLVDSGYVGVDLADMGAKVHAAAQTAADGLHQKALAHDKLSPEQLRTGPALYGLAADTGAAPPLHEARSAFLLGLAALAENKPPEAEAKFTEAAKADPTNKDYVFYRALAVYQGGNKTGALKTLEAELPADPRTGVLKLELALGQGAQTGADELERVLFGQRFSK